MAKNRLYYKKITLPWEPEKIFPYFLAGKYPFFLDSALYHKDIGRYSFMGSNPYLTIKSRGDRNELYFHGEEDRIESITGNPIEVLEQLFNDYACNPVTDLHTRDEAIPPFQNGAVGYLAYDLGWHIEQLPNTNKNDVDLPDAYFSFYDCVLAYDHMTGETFLFSSGLPEKSTLAATRAQQRLEHVENELRSSLSLETNIDKPATIEQSPQDVDILTHFTKEEYCEAIRKAKEYIAAGDIYQMNMTQRFETVNRFDSWMLYKKLRSINPAPFAAYLSLEEGTVVSASPERFIKTKGTWIETRPIKGTMPRTDDELTNESMKEALWNSTKDRAELVMIIDLERNDLGKICEFGTVKVEELFRLETYATVFHLVSTITGKLKRDIGFKEIINAVFPGGSITGAPKIRAMEIIEELEPVKRGIYTGSIGYINATGNLDLNIVIRTIILKGSKAYFQAGGGIVADSVPEKEYQETLDKVKALIAAIQDM